jgi:MYXO-CTERM domain-containing protein
MGDPAKAEAELAKAVAAAPRRTHFSMALAEAQRQQGNTKEAERILKKQKKVSATTAPYFSTYMAILWQSQNESAKAKTELEKATSMLPDYTGLQDLRFLMRVPPQGIEELEKIGRSKAEDATETAGEKRTKGGCACSTSGGESGGAGLAVFMTLAGIFWPRRRSHTEGEATPSNRAGGRG